MTGLAVRGCGLVTALGLNAASTLAAVRAGVSGIASLPWDDPDSGEPLRGAKVALPQWWDGVGKLAELLAPAVDQCLGQADAPRGSVALLVGVAAPARPGRPAGLDASLLDEVCWRLEQPVPAHSRLFALDQAGCAHALAMARRLIESGRARQVVVAGVDSYLREPTLQAYVERRRLMTPDNSNGFFPGEAAGAVLVGAARPGGRDALRLLGMGLAQEAATIEGTEPLAARGLTQAVRQALDGAGVRLKDIAYRLTDLSGEHYKFKEAAFVAGRLDSAERCVSLQLLHPAEYLGEVGAATLPCLLACALHAARKGYANGPLGLVHVGSDAGERAALVVHAALAQPPGEPAA